MRPEPLQLGAGVIRPVKLTEVKLVDLLENILSFVFPKSAGKVFQELADSLTLWQ